MEFSMAGTVDPLLPRPLSRRRFIGGVGASLLAGGVMATGGRAGAVVRSTGNGLALVVGGAPATVVVPPPDSAAGPPGGPATQIEDAVDTLCSYIQKSTGAQLPVRTQAELDAGGEELPSGRVYVGWAGPGSDPQLPSLLDNLDADGYVLDVHGDTLTILGPSDWGTRYGVYELLERHVGVRWLLPGPDGEDVPTHTDLVVPVSPVREEPDFVGRTFTPLFLSWNELGPNSPDWTSTDPQVIWATRNRAHTRTTYLHNSNLYNIFPPRLYADPSKPETYHPEYYPVIGGQTKLPAMTATTGWQPRFDLEATVDVAAAYAQAYFDDNPDVSLLSLGVNDTGGFSETDVESGVTNAVGYPSASASYFRWVNAVVSTVLAARPDLSDRTFAVLAYENVADAPDFDLHPNVLAMITRESHLWSDLPMRTSLQAQFAAWEQRAAQLCWYDYPYGATYVVPRMFLADMAEAYRWAHDHGVRYQYGDMYPSLVGEGPKTWVYAKLLWDADADVDALVSEWCERAVGPAAAADLRSYFDYWERFWTGDALATPFWAFGSIRNYLLFTLACYLDAVPADDMMTCREHLESALAKAVTPAQKARAALVLKEFGYVEASCQSYPRSVAAPTRQAEALMLAQTIRREVDQKVAAAARRLEINAELEADAVLRGRWDPSGAQHSWTGYNADVFFHLLDWLQREQSGASRLRSLLTDIGAGRDAPNAARMARMILDVADGRVSSIAPNGAFEDGKTDAPGWSLNHAIRSEGVGRDGTAGLLLAPRPSLPPQQAENDAIQPIAITPGLTAARIWYRSAAPVTTGIMSIRCDWWTSANSTVQAGQQPMRFLPDTGPEWAWIGVLDDVPASARGKQIEKLRLVASLLSYQDNVNVYWDDFEVYSEVRDNLALGAVVEVSSVGQAGAIGSKVVDGSFADDSRWISAAAGDPMPTVTVDLGFVANIDRIEICSGKGWPDSDPDAFLVDFAVEVRADGVWRQVGSFTGNVDARAKVDDIGGQGDAVRVVITDPSRATPRVARVFEIEVYGARQAG
jgi:hypothetical protein